MKLYSEANLLYNYYLFLLFMETRIEVVTRRGGPQVYQHAISFGPGHYFNSVPYITKSSFRNLSLTLNIIVFEFDSF